MVSEATQATQVKEDIGKNQMVQTQEWHCSGCGRFIGFQAIVWGVVKIKCKCRQWNTLDINTPPDKT